MNLSRKWDRISAGWDLWIVPTTISYLTFCLCCFFCVCAARNHDSQYEFTIYLVEEKKKTICIYGDACIGCELRLINLTQSNWNCKRIHEHDKSSTMKISRTRCKWALNAYNGSNKSRSGKKNKTEEDKKCQFESLIQYGSRSMPEILCKSTIFIE